MEEKRSFEEDINRLDVIVRQLERGDAPLELSLELFQEGAELIRRCEKQLDTAEQVVMKLKKGAEGAPVELPFDMGEERWILRPNTKQPAAMWKRSFLVILRSCVPRGNCWRLCAIH